MLKSLKFVQGAICAKNVMPVLTHFRIAEGKVTGYNGVLALQSPINVDITALPNAKQLLNAISGCGKTSTLTLAENGKLVVSSGNYKVFVDCTVEDFPKIKPEGVRYEMTSPILQHLKKLAPFISKDSTRPWSQGILFDGGSAVVTNNILLIEQWIGTAMPNKLIVPESAIRELLRINEEPVAIRVSDNSCSFIFENGSWLRTQTVEGNFPDYKKIFETLAKGEPIKKSFFANLEKLVPFMDTMQRVFFSAGQMSTSASSDKEGCCIKTKRLNTVEPSCFNLKQLLSLKKVATHIDLSNYPNPCGFSGDKMRGAIIGIQILKE